MCKNKIDGPCQILAGRLGTRAVDECECIVSLLGEFQRMGETIVHGSHIGKSTARIAYGKFSPRFSFEKEQAGVLFLRVDVGIPDQ